MSGQRVQVRFSNAALDIADLLANIYQAHAFDAIIISAGQPFSWRHPVSNDVKIDDPISSLIDGDKLEDAVGLCLSGGGYRAMVFHAGAVFRMNELGLLAKIDRVSSVSGGSMAAAALAVAYPKFAWNGGIATNLRETFLKPILAQAEDSIDVASGFAGLIPFKSAAVEAAESYEANLTGKLRLSSLPKKPRFVFNATNLMTGSAFRFQRTYVADYKVGQFKDCDFKLADVVAASAAFPPFLSPAEIDLSGGTIIDGSAGKMAVEPYTKKAILTDGGVYDNLGTETVWKRCRTVLVSDAGRPFGFEDDPKENWLQQSLRVIDVTMDQSQNLRERILAYAYETGARTGAMWQLSTGVDDQSERPELLTEKEFNEARSISTRLWKMPRETQELLLKAGYAHAASRIRAHYGPSKGGPVDVPGQGPPQP